MSRGARGGLLKRLEVVERRVLEQPDPTAGPRPERVRALFDLVEQLFPKAPPPVTGGCSPGTFELMTEAAHRLAAGAPTEADKTALAALEASGLLADTFSVPMTPEEFVAVVGLERLERVEQRVRDGL